MLFHDIIICSPCIRLTKRTGSRVIFWDAVAVLKSVIFGMKFIFDFVRTVLMDNSGFISKLLS
jgi:hypothetical protein